MNSLAVLFLCCFAYVFGRAAERHKVSWAAIREMRDREVTQIVRSMNDEHAEALEDWPQFI